MVSFLLSASFGFLSLSLSLPYPTLGVFLFASSLAPLVKKVGEERVVEMTNNLCDKLLHGKDQHRDTASIALRTVVAQVAPSLAPSILVTLTPLMIGGISGQVSFWEAYSFFFFRLYMPQVHNRWIDTYSGIDLRLKYCWRCYSLIALSE